MSTNSVTWPCMQHFSLKGFLFSQGRGNQPHFKDEGTEAFETFKGVCKDTGENRRPSYFCQARLMLRLSCFDFTVTVVTKIPLG